MTGLVSDDEEQNEVAETQPQDKVLSQDPVVHNFPQPPTSNGLESLLSERLAMYKQAEANANSNGESARARRYVSFYFHQ